MKRTPCPLHRVSAAAGSGGLVVAAVGHVGAGRNIGWGCGRRLPDERRCMLQPGHPGECE